MGLSMSLCLKSELRLKQQLKISLGERSGDIPLFSLHRIKSLLSRKPIGIGKELTDVLVTELLKQNKKYKVDSGNEWSCLTGLNFTDAVESVDSFIAECNEAASNVPKENKEFLVPVLDLLERKRMQCVEMIKQWFHENYDDLLYLKDGKIPWAVIRRLRRSLSAWSLNSANPFEENINDMVIGVAEEEGIDAWDAEEAWVRMGGKLFKSKKE